MVNDVQDKHLATKRVQSGLEVHAVESMVMKEGSPVRILVAACRGVGRVWRQAVFLEDTCHGILVDGMLEVMSQDGGYAASGITTVIAMQCQDPVFNIVRCRRSTTARPCLRFAMPDQL